MQTRFIPAREARFEAMFDLIAAHTAGRFRALDLGCGPGSLSTRLLDRFPRAEVVAVDLDPLLLEIGRRAGAGGRRGELTWLEADLRSGAWSSSLRPGSFDVAVSTTALHWLTRRELRRLYREIHRLLRPGALFLNGDKAPLDVRRPRLRRITDDALHRRQAVAGSASLDRVWPAWWATVRREPGLEELYRLRQTRFPGLGTHDHEASAPDHLRALRDAGFVEADVAWREFTNVILAAVRS